MREVIHKSRPVPSGSGNIVAGNMLRHVFDRVVAVVGIVLGSPLMLVAGLAIKFSSRGPILFRATRAGVKGAPFTMYKLRTMHVGADAGGAITAAADPRTFPAGRVIRRLKVDELPQLVNVLRGEMGLVGPRPEDLEIVVNHYTPLMWETLAIPPGMTSAGSLHYFSDERQLPSDPAAAQAVYLAKLLPAKIAVDLQYVREPTFANELQILLRTVLAIIGGDRLFDGARRREAIRAERILTEAGAP